MNQLVLEDIRRNTKARSWQHRNTDLFEIERSVITKHLSNIYEEEELDKNSTCAKFAQVQIEGSREVSRLVDFYNLDAIIAVGYRVNSKKATRFRQWATKTLHEYIQKGFILNDELLKNGHPFGKDYFDELLERIREIRASERRAYQKIADVFEQCSFDYDKNSSLTREFYAFVQNKLHYIGELHELISSYAVRLGLDDKFISARNDYIFTNDLKSLSGAIFHKVVFAFKISYVKLIQQHTGVCLPIILDSPSGREVSMENINEMMAILAENFTDHQIIIASIYNSYSFPNKNIIELKDRLLSF